MNATVTTWVCLARVQLVKEGRVHLASDVELALLKSVEDSSAACATRPNMGHPSWFSWSVFSHEMTWGSPTQHDRLNLLAL